MEGLLLLGLVGAGHLFNKQNSDKAPVTDPLKIQPTMPSGDNIYDSDIYTLTENTVQGLAEEQFNESQKEDSKIVNFQKLDPVPANQEKDTKEEDVDKYEGFIFSSATGGYIPDKEFMQNDQGVQAAPFFSGNAPVIENFDDNIFLNASQGIGNEFLQGKVETAPFFSTTANLSNPFGNTFGSYIGDPSRYVSSNSQNNNLPFNQEYISHIDQKDGLNMDVELAYAQRNSIDNTRTINNPKLGYEGRVLRGKEGMGEREMEQTVYKYDPDTYYENSPDRWFTTNGSHLEKSLRPEQILPDTYRTYNNKQELGIAGPSVHEGIEKRPSFKKTLKRQFKTDTERNVGIENSMVSPDFQREGYVAYPNERDVTTTRNHHTNLKSDFEERTAGLLDPVKRTKKQTTINSKNNGYVGSVKINETLGLQDNVKVTKKQTTIHTKHNGNLKGDYEGRTAPDAAPIPTTKDTVLFSHYGPSGGTLELGMDKENYNNAETNPTKEIIAEGRYPTINNVKVSNGKDIMNVDIKKMDHDYMNHRLNASDKVYQLTQSDVTCEVTTGKDRLNDVSIAERIDPGLLDPFKENPYTHSLSSFAY